jgi:hypothetical protein
MLQVLHSAVLTRILLLNFHIQLVLVTPLIYPDKQVYASRNRHPVYRDSCVFPRVSLRIKEHTPALSYLVLGFLHGS